MQPYRIEPHPEKREGAVRPRVVLVTAIMALLLALSLAGCGRGQNGPATATEPSLNASPQTNEAQNVSMSLQPASGYGGLYVQVSGTGWPPNMLVMVTLEDEQGRSSTLAATDTDRTGNLTTGFLFPIDQRWLSSDSLAIVTTTADGRIEKKATFTVVPPGTQIAENTSVSSTEETSTVSTSVTQPSTVEDDAPEVESSKPETDTVAAVDTQDKASTQHTVILPLIASTGPELRNSQRQSNERASRNPSSKAASYVQVNVELKCRKRDGWLVLSILSAPNFDATNVDPGSVSIVGSDLGYAGDGAIVPVAWKAVERTAYQWQWSLDDANGDGSIDMVMEFSPKYLGIKCGAGSVAVTGRTKDGTHFESATQGGSRANRQS